jgi:hypothetical protein
MWFSIIQSIVKNGSYFVLFCNSKHFTLTRIIQLKHLHRKSAKIYHLFPLFYCTITRQEKSRYFDYKTMKNKFHKSSSHPINPFCNCNGYFNFNVYIITLIWPVVLTKLNVNPYDTILRIFLDTIAVKHNIIRISKQYNYIFYV